MHLTRYSTGELNEFRLLVESKLDDTLRHYNAAIWQLQALGGFETSSAHDADFATREALYVKAARLKRNVDNLRSARLRIENKTYGVCIVTGTLIPRQRLLAVPHTTINTEARVNAMRLGA